MSANLTTISNILKDQYLPALKNQITTAPSPFMEMIRKEPLTTGGKITAAAPFGINGGFGFGTDGSAVPVSGARKYRRFEVEPVDMYVDIRISDKTVKLADKSGALLSALDEEVTGSYEAAKWNVSRALFGDGSGKLCNVISSGTASTEGKMTLTVDDVSKIIEGLTVDLYTYASSSASAPQLETHNTAMRVVDVNRTNKKVVIETFSGKTGSASATAGNYGFLTVQGSYNKELTGLKAIFDSNVSTVYGYSKTSDPFVVPVTVNAKQNISDIVIYEAVKKAMDYRNSKIDLVMMGDNAFTAYQKYMHESNVMITEKREFVGGASGYKVLVGSRTVTIVNEKMVPANEAWCVDTSAFSFVHLDFDFCDYGSSGIFQLLPGTTYYRALLASYGNLICKNPGGCVKITNCELSSTV